MAAFYLKYLYLNMHWLVARLYTIDAVSDEVRAKFVSGNDKVLIAVMLIGLIAVGLAIVSLSNKLCHEFVGVVLLVFASLSFLFSFLIFA